MHEQELQDIGKCLKSEFPHYDVSLQGIRETDFEFELVDESANNRVRLVVPIDTLLKMQDGGLSYSELFDKDSGRAFIAANPNSVVYHYSTGFTLTHA